MVIHNYHWLNSASRVLISTCCTPLVLMGERKQFLLLDLDLDLQFQASQGQGRPSCQKSRSKVKRFKQEIAHRQTDGRYKRIIAPATQSIKISHCKCTACCIKVIGQANAGIHTCICIPDSRVLGVTARYRAQHSTPIFPRWPQCYL